MPEYFQPDVTQELKGLWEVVLGLKAMVETLVLQNEKAAASPSSKADELPAEDGTRRVAVYFNYDDAMNKIPAEDGEYGIILTFDAQGGLLKSEHVRRVKPAQKSLTGWVEPDEDVEAEGVKDDGDDDAEGWDAAEDDTADGDALDEDDEDEDAIVEDGGDERDDEFAV